MKIKKFLILLFAINLLFISADAWADIVINEAMINPDAVSDTLGEWFELFNDDSVDIDINGWILKDLGTNYHQIDNGGPLIVPANGFAVLGRNSSYSLNGGYVPNYVYSSFLLTNSEDEIIIENGTGEVTRIEYTNAWPIASGKSLAYKGIGTVKSSNNWMATPANSAYLFGAGDYGTPCSANVVPEPATLLLWISGLLPILFLTKKNSK